jgi:hypothetical protein
VSYPPAKCTRCGHVFVAVGSISMGPGAGATIIGSGTNCPRCGGYAQIGDGTYMGTATGVALQSGPPSTRAMIAQLYGVAKRAKEEDLSVKEIIAEVAEINPALAKKLEKRGLPVFVLIVFLFLFVRHISIEAKIDVNHLLDQAYHIAKGQDPEQHLEELAKKPDAKSSEAEKPPAKESRQQRRHKERQSKKRDGQPSR